MWQSWHCLPCGRPGWRAIPNRCRRRGRRKRCLRDTTRSSGSPCRRARRRTTRPGGTASSSGPKKSCSSPWRPQQPVAVAAEARAELVGRRVGDLVAIVAVDAVRDRRRAPGGRRSPGRATSSVGAWQAAQTPLPSGCSASRFQVGGRRGRCRRCRRTGAGTSGSSPRGRGRCRDHSRGSAPWQLPQLLAWRGSGAGSIQA